MSQFGSLGGPYGFGAQPDEELRQLPLARGPTASGPGPSGRSGGGRGYGTDWYGKRVPTNDELREASAPYDPAETPAPYEPLKPRPLLPGPFNTADSIRLQQLQGNATTVQSQMDAGEIDLDTAKDLHGQISRMIQPLMAKKQAFAEQQQQQEKMQLMDQVATRTSMQTLNNKLLSEQFPQTTTTVVHPMTGEAAAAERYTDISDAPHSRTELSRSYVTTLAEHRSPLVWRDRGL